MVFNFMLQLNITGTVQFSQNSIGQNMTAQKLVSPNASFSLITAVFLFKKKILGVEVSIYVVFMATHQC